jgi:predicted SAM-dependent methyltransferase
VAAVIRVDDPFLAGKKVLEIGGGDCRLKGAVHVDVGGDRYHEDEEVHDVEWGKDLLPFYDGVFDLVYSSHCLEHIHWDNTHPALLEAHRVLRRGGHIEVWVPDFARLIDQYRLMQGHEDGWLDEETHQNDHMRWLNARIFTNYPNDWRMHHRAMFDEPYLKRCLERAGFDDVIRLRQTRTREHYGIQLGMMAVKP